jgi:DNA-binding transcriptional ArsR family regulator
VTTAIGSSLDGTLAALADSNRKAVVDLLSKRPQRAGELASALEMTPAALSRHLRVLRRSGLIAEEGIDEDARVRIYYLRKQPFDELQNWLAEVECYWQEELAAFKTHVERSKRRRKQ